MGALGLATAVAACLVLAGCGGGDDDADTSTPTAEATTAADGTTLPGTDLRVGDKAVVHFAPDPKHESTLRLVVTDVKQGKISDLDQFTMGGAAKASNVFYVRLSIENLGRADLGGEFVPVFGKVTDTLVVQPVTFGSTFAKCDYAPLPKKFVKGKKTQSCVVLLAPDHGKVSAVEWRGPDDEAPISWIVKK